MMLEHAGDDVFFALCSELVRHALDRPVVRFRTTGGEENFLRVSAEAIEDGLPKFV